MGTQKTLPPSLTQSRVSQSTVAGAEMLRVSAARALHTGAQADSGSSLQSTMFPSPQTAFSIHSSQNSCLSYDTDAPPVQWRG